MCLPAWDPLQNVTRNVPKISKSILLYSHCMHSIMCLPAWDPLQNVARNFPKISKSVLKSIVLYSHCVCTVSCVCLLEILCKMSTGANKRGGLRVAHYLWARLVDCVLQRVASIIFGFCKKQRFFTWMMKSGFCIIVSAICMCRTMGYFRMIDGAKDVQSLPWQFKSQSHTTQLLTRNIIQFQMGFY